jgi:hypothetical protein
MDDTLWTPTTFSKNQDRLLASDAAQAFFAAVTAQARGARSVAGAKRTKEGHLVSDLPPGGRQPTDRWSYLSLA